MARLGKPSLTINANMTPMIDVTFLLIVFFVVVSQIVDRDAVSMDLPSPDHAVSGVPQEPEHVTVNLVPIPGGNIEKTRLLGGAIDVYLRADRSTKYEHIHQVIEAIRNVGSTPRLQLIVSGEKK